MGKFRDFDQFRAEAEKDGPTFVLYGEEHSLPPSLPLSLMVRAARLQEAASDEDQVIDPQTLIEMAESVFGEENVKAWTSKGMDVDLLTELIAWIPDAYSDDDDEDLEADSGN